MTSLQQTAMLGGAASAKTASYTLVAADAGTAISMSNASATTITVNTALFASGDTVQITNLGAGICTITSGSATVNTSASLALAQYESGTLDFTSTSAAIFIKGAGAAAASGGMTLLATTTLTGASVTVSSISQSYKHLQLVIRNFLPATDNTFLNIRINGDTATRYRNIGASSDNNTYDDTSLRLMVYQSDNAVTTGLTIINLFDYTNATTWKMANSQSFTNNATTTTNFNWALNNAFYNQIDAITSLTYLCNSGDMTSGTALLYGVS